MVSKTTVIWCGVGVTAGAAILGYCIYFDKKRRNDPEFKRKLREKRQQEKQPAASASGPIHESSFKTLPLEDPIKMQAYFLQQVQMGEELLAAGDDNGIEHFCNAVAVCNSPMDLLAILRETLPPSLFAAVMHRLPEVKNNLSTEIQSRVNERRKSVTEHKVPETAQTH